jgi:hypothetical protein
MIINAAATLWGSPTSARRVRQARLQAVSSPGLWQSPERPDGLVVPGHQAGVRAGPLAAAALAGRLTSVLT